jgi:hypothetical protein
MHYMESALHRTKTHLAELDMDIGFLISFHIATTNIEELYFLANLGINEV